MTDTLPQLLEVFMKRPSTVSQNDVVETISYLSDESVIDKTSKWVNREKFKKLWNGDIPSYESWSEADLALASILAFWCGRDMEHMDRLFRKSGLMQNKWYLKQSGTTYGQITLETARRNVFTTYKPYGISSASDDFSDDELERLNDMQPFKNNHTLVRILAIVIYLLIIINRLPAIFLSGRNGSSTTDKLGKVMQEIWKLCNCVKNLLIN